jgi:hypothetical protein
MVRSLGVLRLVLSAVKNLVRGPVAVATPGTLDDQGRMVGDYLLALDEAGAYSWPVK